MKRVIKNYDQISGDLERLLYARYPNGPASRDIVTFSTSKGTILRGVELRTEDTIYFVRMNSGVKVTAPDFVENDSWEDDDDADTDTEEPVAADEDNWED